jgi:stage II sporulation protein M
MNKRFAFIISDDRAGCLPGLILCGALFLCGVIAGTFSSAFVGDVNELTNYFSEYLTLTQDGAFVDPSFLSVLADTFRYPLLVFALGFSIPGVIGVPILSVVRGYTLAFSVSVLVRLYGGDGVLLALSFFALGTMITVPCFLVLAAQSFKSACLLTLTVIKPGLRAGRSPYSWRYFLNSLLCFGFLALAAVLDTWLTVYMVRFAVSHIC